jgi:hypothetical protein
MVPVTVEQVNFITPLLGLGEPVIGDMVLLTIDLEDSAF